MQSNRYHTGNHLSLADLERMLANSAAPVLLLEGTRALPSADRANVVALGRLLAQRMPRVRFRSGNAEGTDTAFAEGVASVAPERMEYVITHKGMGRGRRWPGVRAVSLDDIPQAAEQVVAGYTLAASPEAHGLVDAYRERGRGWPLGAKGAYLMRDTLKVVGHAESGLAPATAGLFYVNEADPLSGGTGHTIRVCLEHNVPVVMQSVWLGWR